VNDDAFEYTCLAKDKAGKTLWRQEIKFTRVKESQKQQNTNQSATDTSTPVLGQTPEQKVLDQLLGTWSEETTEFKAKWISEEKHTIGVSSYARILGGRFVRETWEDTEKKSSALQLFTYDEQRKCYRIWVFLSKFGGPAAPTSAKWNEAARTLEYFDFPANEGQRPTCQMRFVSDNETAVSYMVQDAAGETLYSAEYKLTRMK
jgi:hypothetical protein